MHSISTIGYEGASIEAFVYTLGVAGVDVVVDVRDVAASRRPGFSKSALRQHLAMAGIEYLHLRSLGDPKEGREAMRRGDRAEFRRVFLRRMESEEAQVQFAAAVELAGQRSIALLCYERDPKDCHRTIIAEMMKEQRSFAIRHLGVHSHRRIVEAEASKGDFSPVR